MFKQDWCHDTRAVLLVCYWCATGVLCPLTVNFLDNHVVVVPLLEEVQQLDYVGVVQLQHDSHLITYTSFGIVSKWCLVVRYGITWYGMLWYGMVRYKRLYDIHRPL